jgi:hypothetical protein
LTNEVLLFLYCLYIQLQVTMGRKSDIRAAYVVVAQLSPKGYRFLRIDDFTRQLRLVNHHFTPDNANPWIERYQPDDRDLARLCSHRDNYQIL